MFFFHLHVSHHSTYQDGDEEEDEGMVCHCCWCAVVAGAVDCCRIAWRDVHDRDDTGEVIADRHLAGTERELWWGVDATDPLDTHIQTAGIKVVAIDR